VAHVEEHPFAGRNPLPVGRSLHRVLGLRQQLLKPLRSFATQDMHLMHDDIPVQGFLLIITLGIPKP
jgi:hypothetical protein